jgi:HPt (histidine-containing phosphotransfer) domain-containing protein
MSNEKIIITIDDEDVLELIPDYLESRRNELDILRGAVTQKDFATLMSYGHKMKGSGGSFGFDRISEIGSKLESAAKAQDRSAIEQEISDLEDYLARVEVIGT